MYCREDSGSGPWSCARVDDNAGVRVRRATVGSHFQRAGRSSTLIAAAVPPGLRCAPIRRHSDERCQTGRKEERVSLYRSCPFGLVTISILRDIERRRTKRTVTIRMWISRWSILDTREVTSTQFSIKRFHKYNTYACSIKNKINAWRCLFGKLTRIIATAASTNHSVNDNSNTDTCSGCSTMVLNTF